MISDFLDQGCRKNLDPQVHDLESVIGQNDFHQILSDVMDITLNRSEQKCAACNDFGCFHMRLKMIHGSLHGFRGL